MARDFQQTHSASPSSSPPSVDLQQQILDLEYGNHTCILYNTTHQQMRATVPFIRAGLEFDDYCLYVVNEHTIEEMESLLEEAGVDVPYHRDRGALRFQTARETFLRDGRFPVDEMLDFVDSAIEEVRGNGFSGFRSTGEMGWFLDADTSPEDIFEYETRLNNVIKDRRAMLLCQYNTGAFPAGVVQKILSAHPIAVIDDLVCSNPFYEPPELLLEETDDKQLLDWKIQQLQDYEQTQKELEGMNRDLERALDGKQTLLREVHHRVKNNMQIMSSLLGLERRKSTSRQIKDILGDCESRISTMGLIHEYLHSAEHIAPIMELQPYVEDLVDRTISSISNEDKEISVTVEAPQKGIEVDLDTIVPIGLCVNELTTNTVRHGFTKGQDEHEIVIELMLLDDDRLRIQFHDNGGGLPSDFSIETEDSLGVNLIHALITKQLKGDITAWSDQGAHFDLTLPLSREPVQ